MPHRTLLIAAAAASLLCSLAFPEEAPVSSDSKVPQFTNALAKETSPYLLQHAHNPVNWHAWGPEAFAEAKRDDKPIFLSVGYSSCHWCHVMERESFENESVAAILNKSFVSIKVDREERPDVDEIYMQAVQLVSGRGGWPMSVFMTADGKPFFGGTYYPPEDYGGRMGFKSLLTQVAKIWGSQREDVLKDAERMSEAVHDQLTNRRVPAQSALDADFIATSVDDLFENFDEKHGGFSLAPKFPPNNGLPYLLLLKRLGALKDSRKLDTMLTLTLDQMALGGIHDHIGGGFHRYSTDERWFLPHFEKMLYDNALLSSAYAQAAVTYQNPEYERVARDICDWVLREMTAPDGGFYSSLDADSEGLEGKFYVWGKSETERLLGADAETFLKIYNAGDDGNFREEHSGKRTGMSIFYLSKPLAEHAQDLKLSDDELRRRVAGWKALLLDARIKRVWPGLDDKVLTAWNGLMIASLARTSVLLNEPRYRDAATKAAEFELKNLRTPDGRWLATHRKGQSKLPAYLDDHAFMALAFIELFDATHDERWKNEAVALMELLEKHFADPRGGGYFFVADDHEKLLARTKDPIDKAIPGGNGIAAQVLVRLWKITGEERYHTKARQLLNEFQGLMERVPQATESLLQAAADCLALEIQKGVAGKAAIKNEPSATRGAVSVELSAGATVLRRGETVSIATKFTVAKGSHIQAHKPDDPYLKATHVTLVSKDLGELGEERYPDPSVIEMPELGQVKVFSGEVTGTSTLKISATAPLGKTALKIKAHFQACDDKACDQPQEVLLSLPVEVVAP